MINNNIQPSLSGKEEIEKIDFNYEGYQVVRGEYFAH